MGDIDDIREADLRNGEPDATRWSETDDAHIADVGVPENGATEMRGEHPIPADDMELERDPSPGEMPSDTDVQAERQP